MGKFILIVAVVLALVFSPAVASAQEDSGGITGAMKSALEYFLDPLQEWVQHILCVLRTKTFNVLGWYFCIECRVMTAESEPDEGGGGWEPHPSAGGGEEPACRDIPDCECSLCPDFLDEYKFYVADAIIWVTGAGNVLANLIPFSLWAELYTIYLELAAFIWCFRLLSKLGLMFFGFLT